MSKILTVAAALSLMTSAVRADEPKPPVKQPVELDLLSTSARNTSSGTLIECRVKLTNNTGKPMFVTSSFHTIFDGLNVIIHDSKGNRLHSQAYIDHQSPYSVKPQKFPVAVGSTAADIVFPVKRLGTPGAGLAIRIGGTVPGSRFRGKLTTKSLKTSLRTDKRAVTRNTAHCSIGD